MKIPGEFAGRTQQIFNRARTLVRAHAVSEDQRVLLEAALTVLDQTEDVSDMFDNPVQLPRLVYAAIRGDDEPALDLVAALLLVEIGIHILDDLQDGDRPAHFDRFRPSEISLAGATLFAALPQLYLSNLDAPPATVVAIHRTLARGLLRASAGQQADLRSNARKDMTIAEAEAVAQGKTGETRAMYAEIAALYAGAAPDLAETYAAFGRALGTASQLTSDCANLLEGEASTDITSGTRTLPIIIHLGRLPLVERPAFLHVLDQARHDRVALDEVRRQIIAAGDLRRCALVIEVYRQRALRALELAGPPEPARAQLRWLIDRRSLFRTA